MGCTERVVDVHVGERRELGRQLRVVLRLPRLVADVLEHEDVATGEVLGERAHLRADDARRECHVGAGQLRQSVGGRTQRQPRLAVLGTAEVRDQDQPGAAVTQLVDRRQRRADPRVVRNRAVLERHVEVDTHQYALSIDVPEIVQCPHSNFCAISNTRLEYPHSLSYHETTLTIVPSMTAVSFESKIDDAGLLTMSDETIGSSV